MNASAFSVHMLMGGVVLQSRNLSSTLANQGQSLTMFSPINTAFKCNVFSVSCQAGDPDQQPVCSLPATAGRHKKPKICAFPHYHCHCYVGHGM